MWRGALAAQGAFQADIGSLLGPGVGHAEQVVGDVRVPGVELGGEQLAEGGEGLALAAEVGLALPRLAVVGLAVVLKQGLQGVARGAHLGVEVLALGLVLLQQLLVGVRFLPELDLLVVVVQLPGALPLPDELLGLGLHQVQLVGDGSVGARPLPHLLRQLHQHQLLLVLSLEVVVLALVDGLGHGRVDQRGHLLVPGGRGGEVTRVGLVCFVDEARVGFVFREQRGQEAVNLHLGLSEPLPELQLGLPQLLLPVLDGSQLLPLHLAEGLHLAARRQQHLPLKWDHL